MKWHVVAAALVLVVLFVSVILHFVVGFVMSFIWPAVYVIAGVFFAFMVYYTLTGKINKP